MSASAALRPASGRTVAIRRPGCTAGFGAPSSGPSSRAQASRSATVTTSPQRPVGPLGLHDLEHELAEPVEGHRHAGPRLGAPPQRRARGLERGDRAVEVAGERDDVIDGERAVRMDRGGDRLRGRCS